MPHPCGEGWGNEGRDALRPIASTGVVPLIAQRIAASCLAALLAMTGTRATDLYNLLTDPTFCLILFSVRLDPLV